MVQYSLASQQRKAQPSQLPVPSRITLLVCTHDGRYAFLCGLNTGRYAPFATLKVSPSRPYYGVARVHVGLRGLARAGPPETGYIPKRASGTSTASLPDAARHHCYRRSAPDSRRQGFIFPCQNAAVKWSLVTRGAKSITSGFLRLASGCGVHVAVLSFPHFPPPVPWSLPPCGARR